MMTITWLDPRTDDADEPAWAVWETECNAYRVYYDAQSDTYSPRSLVETRRGTTVERTWTEVAPPQPTLEHAMQAINDHHCDTHNLTIVS